MEQPLFNVVIAAKTGVQFDELNGVPCITFQLTPEPRKSIRSSRSFKPELSHIDDIAAALSLFTTRAMEKLRKQHSMTQMITVFIQSNPFKEHVPTIRKAQSFGLLTATNDTIVVAKYARQLLHHLHEPGIPIKKAGIILDELTTMMPCRIACLQGQCKSVNDCDGSDQSSIWT